MVFSGKSLQKACLTRFERSESPKGRVELYSIKAKTSAVTTEGVAKCSSRIALKEVSSGSTCQ